MLRPILAILATFLSSIRLCADFDARYEAICQAASPAQLYTFLYALPKGGDLHNHFGGANRSEWMWAILTDPSRNGGDTFYARERFNASPRRHRLPPPARHTIRQATYDALPALAQRRVHCTDCAHHR
ncbi:MAG: hypothetical protein J6386_21215 [Candidatus Synoicihabitans palmerolidicus]|nr:hypothetical protein [Candidatus Synoicihabitans palmerolidicus]